MSDHAIAAERQPGDRCCLPIPEDALDDDLIAEVTSNLEVLAHPVRFRLLLAVARSSEPACVCDLEAIVPVKQPTVSHHLKLLKSVGLVDSERRGHWTYYFVRKEAVRALRERVLAGVDALAPKVETN